MSTTINNELINELEIHEITDAIVNAAKGNKPVKKSKKTVSLTDEIKACFNDDKSMNESIASIEELIKAKVDAAIASTQAQAVAADTKPKKKRATKDTNTKVVESEESTTVDNTTVDNTTTTVADLPAKKKRATKAKKVVEEPQQVEVIDSVDEISDILAKTSLNDATAEVVEETKTEKPKKKSASKKVVDEEAKPKKKTAVKVKKTTDTEVSDSDSDEPNTLVPTEDKPKKKPVSKSKKVELPVEEVIEPVKNGFLEPVVNMEDNEADDSSVKTSDFIQPLTITDELEEDELSDIEE